MVMFKEREELSHSRGFSLFSLAWSVHQVASLTAHSLQRLVLLERMINPTVERLDSLHLRNALCRRKDQEDKDDFRTVWRCSASTYFSMLE